MGLGMLSAGMARNRSPGLVYIVNEVNAEIL